MITRLKDKNIIVETKSGNKLFGSVKEIDTTPELFNWLIIIDRNGKEQIFNDTEIARIEVAE